MENKFGQLFQKYDTDGDGRLGRADFERMMGGMLERLGGGGGGGNGGGQMVGSAAVKVSAEVSKKLGRGLIDWLMVGWLVGWRGAPVAMRLLLYGELYVRIS